MGKGRPSARETAKEKNTKPQKPVSAKSGGKKSAAAGPGGKKSTAPRAATSAKPATPAKAAAPVKNVAETAAPTGRPAKPGEPAPAAASPENAQAPVQSTPLNSAQALTRAKPAPAETSRPPEPQIQKPVVPVAQPPADLAPKPTPAGSPELDSGISSAAQPDQRDGVSLPAAGGKVGVFGGPKDRSVKPDDKLGLPTGRHYQYEQFRSLNPKGYYCAMRWEYRQQHMSAEEGKRWWANKKIVVTNPANDKSVVVRAVDYGPHETTGLAIGISPGAAEAIGVEPGQDVVVAFADERAQLGPVVGQPDAAN